MKIINQMRINFERFIWWIRNKLKLTKVESKLRFVLTEDTLDQVNMYGGVEWNNQQFERQLALAKSDKERDELYQAEIQEREFYETERNREYLAMWFGLLTQEQKRFIEDKVERGERIYRYDVNQHFSIARTRRAVSEPEY